MLTKKTMITFYLACGYDFDVAEKRADKYMKLQKEFHQTQSALAAMTEQDEFRLTNGEREMSYEFKGFYIPERMMGGITRYVEQGIPPGHFLSAVISNDLSEAVSRADEENIKNLPAYIGYLYNEVPSSCWGSPEKMKAWIIEHKPEDV